MQVEKKFIINMHYKIIDLKYEIGISIWWILWNMIERAVTWTQKLWKLLPICITFFRYDCNTTVAKGRLLISPGDLTHIFHVNPVSNGKFEFISSKLEGGDVLCQEVHGKSYCPGFDDSNSFNMEK